MSYALHTRHFKFLWIFLFVGLLATFGSGCLSHPKKVASYPKKAAAHRKKGADQEAAEAQRAAQRAAEAEQAAQRAAERAAEAQQAAERAAEARQAAERAAEKRDSTSDSTDGSPRDLMWGSSGFKRDGTAGYISFYRPSRGYRSASKGGSLRHSESGFSSSGSSSQPTNEQANLDSRTGVVAAGEVQQFIEQAKGRYAAAKNGGMDIFAPSDMTLGDTRRVRVVVRRPSDDSSASTPIGGPRPQESVTLKVDDEMQVTLASDDPLAFAISTDDPRTKQGIQQIAQDGQAEWQWNVKALKEGNEILTATAEVVYRHSFSDAAPVEYRVTSRQSHTLVHVKPWYQRLAIALVSATETDWKTILAYLLPGGAGAAAIAAWWKRKGKRSSLNRRR